MKNRAAKLIPNIQLFDDRLFVQYLRLLLYFTGKGEEHIFNTEILDFESKNHIFFCAFIDLWCPKLKNENDNIWDLKFLENVWEKIRV